MPLVDCGAAHANIPSVARQVNFWILVIWVNPFIAIGASHANIPGVAGPVYFWIFVILWVLPCSNFGAARANILGVARGGQDPYSGVARANILSVAGLIHLRLDPYCGAFLSDVPGLARR